MNADCRKQRQNRCAVCGRFAAWKNLTSFFLPSIDILGNFEEEQWYEHSKNTGCKLGK